MSTAPARSRRFFLRTLTRNTAVAAGVMTVPGALSDTLANKAHGAEATPRYPRTRIADVRDLQTGQPVSFNYPNADNPNVLVKVGSYANDGVGPDGDIVAFSALCPHMGCNLASQYNPARPTMLGPCPCHFSAFDISRSGMQIQGVASQDLPQIALEVEGNDVYAVGVRGLLHGHAQNPN